jgi:hypothetical protein
MCTRYQAISAKPKPVLIASFYQVNCLLLAALKGMKLLRCMAQAGQLTLRL